MPWASLDTLDTGHTNGRFALESYWSRRSRKFLSGDSKPSPTPSKVLPAFLRATNFSNYPLKMTLLIAWGGKLYLLQICANSDHGFIEGVQNGVYIPY